MITIGEDRVQATKVLHKLSIMHQKTHRLLKYMHSGKNAQSLPPLKNVSAFAHSRRPLELFSITTQLYT